MKYSVLIQWSDEDHAFLVTIPEFGSGPKTHGDTYKQAFRRAHEVLELLVDTYQQEGLPLPKPWKHGAAKPSRREKKPHRAAKSA
jgi:antitoxin HicB